MIEIIAQPLTKAGFAPFGDVLELRDTPDKMINQDMCGRHHDLADLDFADGSAGISLFDAIPRELPYHFNLVERHPLGSQAFIPMSMSPFWSSSPKIWTARPAHRAPLSHARAKALIFIEILGTAF